MNVRMRFAAFCVAAVALLGAAAVIGGSAFAQDSTGTPEAGSGTPAVGSDTQASAYQDFVDGLAANLGISDPATVDAAIKTTLKQQVDAELAAGNISANDATALKERIDAADFGPFLFGVGQHDGHGIGGPGRGGHDHPGTGKNDNEQDDGSGASPTGTPTSGL
ncbi:MAG TPA: hypothetical protein VHR64_12560 [Thermomicrobiales bacterium]|nr:hypothetical protein [Thermomicrobiales bacterium]